MTALANVRPVNRVASKALSPTQRMVLEMAAIAYFIVAAVTSIMVKVVAMHIPILVLLYLGITWPTWLIPAGFASIR